VRGGEKQTLDKKTLFVSCQCIDAEPAQIFIEQLRLNGFTVEHSPRNPADGVDERWNDWYERSLAETISRSLAFIIILDRGWDCSTWMAIEADEANGGPDRRPPMPMFFYNPMAIKVSKQAIGMHRYLKEELPTDAKTAADLLSRKVGLEMNS